MRDRKIVLEDIIQLRGDLEDLKNELSQFPWDSEVFIAKIYRKDVIRVFEGYLNDVISNQEIEVWANLIECRDDIAFEDTDLQEIIFEFANPEINGHLTKMRASELLVAFR